MNFKIHCPNGHSVLVKEEFAGKTGLCPQCRAKIRVPAVGQQADGLCPSDEFVHQDPRHDRPSSTNLSATPFPAQKKARLCLGCGKSVSQSFTACPRCGTRLCTYHHLNVRKEGDAIVVHFVQRQLRDESIVRETAEELCTVADQMSHSHIVLDFSGVVGVSSMMLGKLVMLQLKLKKTLGDLKLRNVGPQVREVLATTKLDHTLHLEEMAWPE
jgi:anti-sigma B factor antagonist